MADDPLQACGLRPLSLSPRESFLEWPRREDRREGLRWRRKVELVRSLGRRRWREFEPWIAEDDE